MVKAVLGLGSNRGDSQELLRMAIRDLSSVMKDLRVSSVYRTAPRDYENQDEFLNIACAGWFSGTPCGLLDEIQAIEARHGRDRSAEIPKGPRTLDIDILLFGNEVIRDDRLVIPHERMRERCFALVPLLEIAPESADPETGESFSSICGRLGDQGVRKAGSLHG